MPTISERMRQAMACQGRGEKKINCLSFAQYHAHERIILHTRIRAKILNK